MNAIGSSVTAADQIRSYAPKDARKIDQKDPISEKSEVSSAAKSQEAKEVREVEKNVETDTKNAVTKEQDNAVSRANETTQRGSSIDLVV